MAAFLLVLDWLIVLAWAYMILSTLRNIRRVPNLLDPGYARPLDPTRLPLISVIIPARNEEASIEATLRALLAVDSVPIHIFAVDDRSTDSTGAIMDRVAAETDRVAAESPCRLTVLHVTDLPPGWLGKPHAMAFAARQATTPWLLFTDADVLFAPGTLLRALNLAQAEDADHLVLFPTMILKGFGERMMLAVFHLLGTVFAPPWRVPDPQSRASLGIGAFNLIRAEAYRAIGGFESLRMEVVEDIRIGVKIKRAGYRQRIAVGPDLIRVRWAEGARHFILNVTKNFFALFRFRTRPALIACATLTLFCLAPFIGFAGPSPFRIAGAFFFLMLFFLYRCLGRFSHISPAFFLTFPIAAALLIYALLRSVIVTLRNGGIRWRDTFYPLSDLRETAGPTF